jgi:hypothetical protein
MHGRLDKAHMIVDAMEATGYDAAKTRARLVQLEAVLKKVRSCSLSHHKSLQLSFFGGISTRAIYNYVSSSKVRLRMGDRVLVRNNDDEPWVRGIVQDLVDGRPHVHIDFMHKASSWNPIQPQVIAR